MKYVQKMPHKPNYESKKIGILEKWDKFKIKAQKSS